VSDYIAFGVEPNRRAPYELRQSRYQALAEDVAKAAREMYQVQGRPARLLDVGVFDGVSRRYIEAHGCEEQLEFEAVDIYPKGREFVYKHAEWTHHEMDLRHGMPSLASDAYDIVICEQVLEHLQDVGPAIHDLVRVLRPGGLLIVGVPIFPPGLDLVRKYVVPKLDQVIAPSKRRGHVQAWSLRSFLKQFMEHASLALLETRGFRIISGGVLRPLEFTRTWWQLGRMVGKLAPSLCTEVQILATKTAAANAAARPTAA
jgi:SAM-dependent methyltransferase